MEQAKNLRLISTEIGALWTHYMNDTMASCYLKYFLHKAKDLEIRSLLEFALGLSQKHIESITRIFKQEGIPIPAGYSDSDVNVNAPRLYSDTFALRYLRHMGKSGLAGYALSVYLAVRQDVREFYYACERSVMELNERVIQVHLSKGVFIRAPYLPIPKQVEFVQAPNFMGGLTGSLRPLNAMELMHLFANVQTNAMSRALLIGFSQVAECKDVRQFMVRGQEISKKHIEVLSKLFIADDLSAPETWDSEVTDSTVAPFSDKLMMMHVISLVATGMANYGVALGASTRIDVAADYGRLMAETAQFGEDGAQIMIKHGWLEQPPQAANRRELAMSGSKK
ncbi:MAG: DUF3231 family protein [Negativicutes bacterium]|nr:DUF3231 family protein [Negativicutes bacterium]